MSDPQLQPPGPPVQKSKATPVILIVLGVVFVLCLGCGGAFAYFTWWAGDKAKEIVDQLPTDFPTAPGNGNGNGNQTGPHTIRYELQGSGEAFITWADTDKGANDRVQLPWSKEITIDKANFGASVNAAPTQPGTVLESCKITIDGVERKTAGPNNNVLSCAFVYVTTGG